jgi:hypothetical protein
VFGAGEPGLPRDARCGRGIVTGDHHDADPGAPALRHRSGRRRPQRVF